ncbi:hypothetical protein GN156_07880 [bacterium LRH843]|nr:hypothetical protein [bacterium LRH843]
MEEEQLELVKLVVRVDLENLMVPETRALGNPVNLMVPETRALGNLEIDAPIADHNLYRSILSDYTFKFTTLTLIKSLKY